MPARKFETQAAQRVVRLRKDGNPKESLWLTQPGETRGITIQKGTSGRLYLVRQSKDGFCQAYRIHDVRGRHIKARGNGE